MHKNSLDVGMLAVESFEATPNLLGLKRVGQGTACFETCANDPTSDPAADTCSEDCKAQAFG